MDSLKSRICSHDVPFVSRFIHEEQPRTEQRIERHVEPAVFVLYIDFGGTARRPRARHGYVQPRASDTGTGAGITRPPRVLLVP